MADIGANVEVGTLASDDTLQAEKTSENEAASASTRKTGRLFIFSEAGMVFQEFIVYRHVPYNWLATRLSLTV